jgi:hypothetical protein
VIKKNSLKESMMFKYLVLVPFVLGSSLSSAQTFSEKRATGMVNVLQSDPLKELLQQEDGVGNITGIEYHNSLTADVADRFKVSFKSYYGLSESNCSVIARVDGSDGTGRVSLSPIDCVETGGLEDTPEVCNNPSPIGCQD